MDSQAQPIAKRLWSWWVDLSYFPHFELLFFRDSQMRNYFFANKWEGHRTLIFSVCSDVPNSRFLPTFAIGLQLNLAIQEVSDSSECHTSIPSDHIIIHFDVVATCPSFTGSSKFNYRFDPWRWCLAILPCQLAKKSILNQGILWWSHFHPMDSHQFPDFPMDSPNGLTSPSCCAVISSGKPALRAATTMGASEELPRYCQVRSPESSSRARRVPLERMEEWEKKMGKQNLGTSNTCQIFAIF